MGFRSLANTNLCTVRQPVVKIYFLESVNTKAIRVNNRFVDFAIIADKCISYILMQYCLPHHIFYSKQFPKPPYAIIFQSFQSASFSIGIYSASLLSLIFGAVQFSAWLLLNSEESGPTLFDKTHARLPLREVLQKFWTNRLPFSSCYPLHKLLFAHPDTLNASPMRYTWHPHWSSPSIILL